MIEVPSYEFTIALYQGEELAAKLSEPKAELMIGVVDLVGAEVINYSGSR